MNKTQGIFFVWKKKSILNHNFNHGIFSKKLIYKKKRCSGTCHWYHQSSLCALTEAPLYCNFCPCFIWAPAVNVPFTLNAFMCRSNQCIINGKLSFLFPDFAHLVCKKQINESTNTVRPELGICLSSFCLWLSTKLALLLPALPSCFRVPFVSLRWNFDALTKRRALPAQGLGHTRTLGWLWASHQDVAACVYCCGLWFFSSRAVLGRCRFTDARTSRVKTSWHDWQTLL